MFIYGSISITKSIFLQNYFFLHINGNYSPGIRKMVCPNNTKKKIPLHTKHVPAMCVRTQPVIRPLKYDEAKDISCV